MRKAERESVAEYIAHVAVAMGFVSAGGKKNFDARIRDAGLIQLIEKPWYVICGSRATRLARNEDRG